MNRKQGVLILAVLLVILGFIVHHYSGWGWKDIRKQIPIGTTTGLKGVLLVNFETQSDDELPWGPYCARVLYSKLHYAPNEIMYLPYISWLLTDMGDNGIHYPKLAPLNIETEKYYAKVYNAGYILHGKIIKTTDQLQFRGYLYDCQQQSMLPEMNLTVPMNQPEDLFIQIAQQVTSQLKIKLSPETVKYLQLKNTGNATAFPIALQGFSTEPENFAAAADLYSRAVQADGNFLFAYMGYSDRMSNANTEEALSIIRRGLDQFPENGYLREAELLALEDADHQGDLTGKCSEFRQKNPDNLMSYLCEAGVYIDQEQFDQAENLLKEALGKYPNNGKAKYNFIICEDTRADKARQAKVYADMTPEEVKIYEKYNPLAFKEARELAEIHPRSPKALSTLLGLSYTNNMSRTDIESLFTRITTINPHYYGAYNAIRFFYTTGWEDEPEVLRDLLAEGLRLNDEDPRFAQMVLDNLNWYQKVRFERAHEELIIFQKDTATIRLAQNILKSSAEKNPQNQNLIYQAAETYRKTGDYTTAWSFYERLPDPPEPMKGHEHEYYLNKARVAQGIGNHERELYYADKCLSSGACNVCGPYALLLKGHLCIVDKKFPEAFSNFQKAIDINPEMRDCYSEYAFWAGQYDYNVDKGIEYINKAIAIEPENPRFYGILSRLYLSKKDKANAMKYIDKAIMMKPTDDWFPKVKQKIVALP